jgi:hypothetical protein
MRTPNGNSVEHVAVSRNQFALAGIEMRQSTEAVDLPFENVVVRIEGIGTAREAHGA